MVANAIVQTKKPFSSYLQDANVLKTISSTLNSKDVAKFITATSSLVANNPALQDCDYKTIVSGALLGESLKLSCSPQLGQFYLVPFNDTKNNRKVAQFILGYKGLVQLAIRSGQYTDLNVIDVKEGEFIGIDEETGKPLVRFMTDYHKRLNTPTIGYFAYFKLLNGFRKSLFWTREQMEIHADKYSQAFSLQSKQKQISGKWKTLVSFDDYKAGKYDKKDEWLYSSYWYKNFDDMAFKTMLKQLISKWGIMSIEFQTAVEKDMAVIKDDMQPVYVDNVESEPVAIPQTPQIEVQPEEQEKAETQTNNDDPFSNFEE